VVLSMRDLGEGVSAGFWDEEVARLLHVRHPSAARVLDARIVDDRFFVVKTKVPADAVPLKARLAHGPLDGHEAVLVALAALEVAVELHALALSAAGTRLRSAMRVNGPDGAPGYLLTTYGLHVDNGVEIFNELREIALRVAGLVGGRHERGDLIVPEGVLSPEVELLFRRAVGLDRPPLQSARDMLDELAELSGLRDRRSRERVPSVTRPLSQAASVYGSDLLLAEEFFAAGRFDETPGTDEDER
jgi:hypothetical protein